MRILRSERELINFVNGLPPEVAVGLYEILRDHPKLRTTRGISLIYDTLMKDCLLPDPASDPYDEHPETERQDSCRRLLVYRAVVKKWRETGKLSRLTREEARVL